MDDTAVLAAFDAEMRQRAPAPVGARFERHGTVVRLIGDPSVVLYSHLDSGNAREVVAEETAFFRSLGREVEWKLYGHDTPANLGELLGQAGYVPDPPETFLVLDLSRPIRPVKTPTGLTIVRVADEAGLRTALSVNDEAFGARDPRREDEFARRLTDPTFALYVAYMDDVPVASARLELPEGRSFASLWGGGTVPRYRGRGIYRSLVAYRSEVARALGYRFLTVDALPTSRPILSRLGFRPLDTVTGWVLKPAGSALAGVARETSSPTTAQEPSRGE